jgi:argininosuccinate synthase
MEKVVLAYSGGLDTSIILKWIQERYGAQVVTYTGDVGQGADEIEKARTMARATGAAEVIVEDLRRELVEECIFPALRANAVYEHYYLLGTALARPVLARGLVRAAEASGADAIAHGATGKGNDQVRFELSAYALKPDIRVIAPWREWDLKGRKDLLAYARQHGIEAPGTSSEAPPFSMDANLMHISYEGGVLEDPWAPPPAGMYRMTVDPEEAPAEPQHVTVEFRRGNPVAVDGEALAPVELVERVNETPGLTLLQHAHRAVESITLDRELHHLRDELIPRYAEMVYNGTWFSPEREALQSFMDSVQSRVNGEARLKLYKGHSTIVGRRSKSHTLYDEATATFEADEVYDQKDATGFIRLRALRLRTLAAKRISEGE